MPTPGEIDVMEWYGNTPNKIWSTIHFPSGLNGLDKNDESRTQPFSIPESFSDAFHTFAVLWEPKEITFFVDARRFATFRPSDATTWPFDSAFYLILNGNVGPQPNRNMGGNWGSSSPSVYSVDWIRYRNANGLGETSAR